MEEVATRIIALEGDVLALKQDVGELKEAHIVHERELYGGLDEDGERKVSVIERIDDIAHAVKGIEQVLTNIQKTAREWLAIVVKLGMRAAWFMFGVGCIALWQVASHWDKIVHAAQILVGQ